MNDSISTLDLAIIASYFVVVLFIGFWVGRKTKTGEDLFLGGRSLTWGAIGLSLFASNISSSTIIGLSGAAYTSGIAASNYEWISGLPLILAAAVYIPLYLRSRITTIPEYLELRFDNRSRAYFSILTIFATIVVETAGGLYAGAIVLKVFFPGLIIWQTTLVLAFVAGIYTAFGGLKAVVYTDTIQAIILIVGTSVLTYILFERLDFSWETVKNSVPKGHLSVIKPIDDPSLPWLGTLVGVPVLGFWYWVTNQYITQRILGAKNITHARFGAMLGGLLKIIPLFIMVLPGAMAITLFPGLANGDMVFPTMVSEVLPVGFVGIVLAGLISAIMSSVDSTLNSSSTLVVNDFVLKRNPNISNERIAFYGRITTVVLMVVAALWAPKIADFGGIWLYLQQVYSIIVPPVAALFLMGVFYRKGNGTAAFITLLAAHIIGTILFVLTQFDLYNVHFTINVGIMTLFSASLFYVLGELSPPPPDDKIRDTTYRRELTDPLNQPQNFWSDYRFWAVVLFLSMLAVLILFW